MTTVQVPRDVMEKLEKRAAKRGVKPQKLAVEILRKGLAAKPRRARNGNGQKAEPVVAPAPPQTESAAPAEPETERERLRRILREAGLTRPVSPELLKKYVKPRSPEERAAMLERLQQISFTPTLSEMIIEDRGPR